MTGVALTIQSDLEVPTPIGWRGIILDRTLWSAAHGLWIFGTDAPSFYPAGFTGDRSVADYSFADGEVNPYEAANVGASPDAVGFMSSSADYYQLSFTGTQLVAAGTPNQASLFAVVKANTTGNALAIGCMNGVNANGFGLSVASANYRATIDYAVGDAQNSSIANDADTGTVYEFIAATFISSSDMIAYRRKPGAAMQTATPVTLTGAVAGSELMRIGRAVDGSHNQGLEIVMAGAFNRALTAAEIATLWTNCEVFCDVWLGVDIEG